MFNALALISVLAFMLSLKTFVGIFQSIMASAMRWKENINIESSVRLSRDRDLSALTMILPFCLTVFRFRLYNPTFIANLADSSRLWAIIGTFITYFMVRKAASFLVHPRTIPQKTYTAAWKSASTFFILLTIVIMTTGSVLAFCEVSTGTIRSVLLWLSALIYGLYLVRKLQIFASSCSIFAAFLYLCALEILPTGILVVSDVIF